MVGVDVGEGLAGRLKGDIVDNSNFRIENRSCGSDARESAEYLKEEVEDVTARRADEGDTCS